MIELIIGCMFSGKSTELIRIYDRFRIAKKRCIMLKHSFDTRYDANAVSTHTGVKINCISVNKLMDVDVQNYDVICIDEAQFFDDLIEFCEKEALDKYIVVAGLDADYKMNAFSNITNLVPKCDIVRKLNAVCSKCGDNASFSKRITSETDVNVIGGQDKYISVCRNCFYD